MTLQSSMSSPSKRASGLHRSSNISSRIEPKGIDLELITSLRQENGRLKTEWETCEALLAGSQNDNRQKHIMIESQKEYIKELEKLLELSLGPQWKFDHAIRSPLSHSVASCTPSTPLPKPGANLRHSISVIGTGNRSSRVLGSMSLGSALEQLQEIEELDATPHAALRRLEGRAGPAPVISQPTCDTDAPHESKLTEEGAQDPQSSSADLDPTVPKLSSESGPIVDPRQVPHSPQKPANDSQTPISPFSPSPLVDVDLVREMLDAMESRARARERRIGDLVQEARGMLVEG